MKKVFRELLHAYRVDAYKIHHNHDDAVEEQTKKEITELTSEALNHAFKYHFHDEDDPSKIETFNMIKNYTLESILPPVLRKVMRRVVMLENQHQATIRLIEPLRARDGNMVMPIPP